MHRNKEEGNADYEKVKELAEEARRRGMKDVADGLIILHGVCGRPRDMKDLEWDRVDLELGMVYLERKATNKKKATYGKYEEHAVVTREAQKILESRKARRTKDERVLPGWNAGWAREIVKAAAKRMGWNEKLKWDGPHVLRHGVGRRS